MYKACLDRRKAQEQYILNLRYPDKTSDEYLEYLENSTDGNTEYRSCNDSDSKERYLYEYLVNTVGTETDIRKRQQLFVVKDRIYNKAVSEITISSGSLSEGFDLPGSDIDIMFVIGDVDVIRDVRNIKHPVQNTQLVMETDNDHPGFTRLRLIAGGDGENDIITYNCFESTGKGLYLSVIKFINNINRRYPQLQLSSHGPCLSDKNQYMDYAFCLRSKYLPFKAMQWASRYRHQWPPHSAIDKSKSSTFIIDVCKHFYAEISQKAAQLLPRPTITTDRYNIHKRYHRHLQDGLKADAVTGWLLYASFYYVTGQYCVTLRITDYVLSKCSPAMILLGYNYYNEGDVLNYRNHVHPKMTLNDRMIMKTVRYVTYIQHSSLIPRELQLEVKDQYLCVQPTVMIHCLRFLCYHHLRDITNRQQVLRKLYLTMKNRDTILSNSLSHSITILGVCYEISGNKDAASHCYDTAVKCDGVICLSAKARISKL
ncbi:unnamed protein product [Mytilus coruscus]|uniref:Uncharacterized protein n=1 Tax=Mytilus coruscus TaxID=42192 RepID=A0A6J8BIR5_MYTCO|nr:unnamed protein product [Mytilus coruscus]